MRKRTHGRECALKILYQHEVNPEQPGDELFEAFWAQTGGCEDDVRSFAEDLVRGTLSHLDKINLVINKYAENWDLNRMAIIDRSILRFATYELLFCADIPPKVTINEAVNLAKKFSQEDSGKFVNGVLDKINHSEKP
ncbi:MAG: transcription antitermination factor NusB [Candidatus Omnitrophota bacterium]|nr:transcription antitermination factor NusB [Candidatus Omnitrophota bacterium]